MGYKIRLGKPFGPNKSATGTMFVATSAFIFSPKKFAISYFFGFASVLGLQMATNTHGSYHNILQAVRKKGLEHFCRSQPKDSRIS